MHHLDWFWVGSEAMSDLGPTTRRASSPGSGACRVTRDLVEFPLSRTPTEPDQGRKGAN
jgi:hypothetical protein